MADRITLTVPMFMPLDGLWQVALPGNVVDVPDHTAFAGSSKTSVVVGGGTLASHGKPTPVGKIRRSGE